MKIVYTSIFFLAFFYTSYSQTVFKFVDVEHHSIERLEVLVGGVLFVSDKHGVIINNKPSHDSIHIETFHVGYQKLDTIVLVNGYTAFTFILQKESYNLREAVVSSKKEVTQRDHWIVSDMTVFDDKLLVLSRMSNKKSLLYVFDGEGRFQSKKEMAGYHTIDNVFDSNNLLLRNTKKGVEISGDHFESINEVKPYTYYEKYYKPFAFLNDKYAVQRQITHFKKKIDYHRYDRDNVANLTLLYSIYDDETYEYSKEEYDNIIAMYYYSVNTQTWESINYGMPEINIVESGTWSGDLKDLINDANYLHKAIGYWEALNNNVINYDDMTIGQSLIILDGLNNKLVEININSNETQAYPISPSWNNYKFVTSNSADKIYFGDDTHIIAFDMNTKTFEEVRYAPMISFSYNKKVIIDDNVFVLGRSSGLTHKRVEKVRMLK